MFMPKSPDRPEVLIGYDKANPTDWIALPIADAQSWELQGTIQALFDREARRTLFRLPNSEWVLVEEGTCRERRDGLGKLYFEVLTDQRAAEALFLNGIMPPPDII